MPNLRGKTLLKRILPIFFIIQRTADVKKERAIKTFIRDLLNSYGETSKSNADVGLKAYILTYGNDIFYESKSLVDCDNIDLETVFGPADIGGKTCTKKVMERLSEAMSCRGVLVDFYYIPRVFWFADEVKGEKDVYNKIRVVVSENEFIAKSCRNVICSNWEKRIDFSAFTSVDGDLVNAFPAMEFNATTKRVNETLNRDSSVPESFSDYQSQLTDFIRTHPLKTEPINTPTVGVDRYNEYKRAGNDSMLTDKEW